MLDLSSSQLRYLRLAALLALLVLVPGLFVGGAQPGAVGLFPVPWDKVAHLALFAVLAGLIGISGSLLIRPGRNLLLLAFFGAVLIGVADEWHQAYLPGRFAGWDDFGFDVAGALLGAWLLARMGLVRH